MITIKLLFSCKLLFCLSVSSNVVDVNLSGLSTRTTRILSDLPLLTKQCVKCHAFNIT